MTDKTADFTQGSILKKLVAFMMPVLGALILLPPGFLQFLPEVRF